MTLASLSLPPRLRAGCPADNLINGKYACENKATLKEMLKGTYNFSGFVVSDWGATHSTVLPP